MKKNLKNLVVLDDETIPFFSMLLNACSAEARPFIKLARRGELLSKDKGGRLDGNPMSEADIRIQELIVKVIDQRYPEAGFLGEEESQLNREPVPDGWPQLRKIVDPLDGSKPFGIGGTHWTVCNGVIQQKDSPADPWRSIFSMAYAPEKGLAVLADDERVLVRSNLLFVDNEWHNITEVRPAVDTSGITTLGKKELKGKQVDFRLVGHEKKQAQIWTELGEMGLTLRNVGPIAATFLEMLVGKPDQFGLIGGQPGGPWDFEPAKHFLGVAGFETGLVTYPGMAKDGGDYPVFIAAGSKALFKYLEGMVGRGLGSKELSNSTVAIAPRADGATGKA